MLCGVTFRIGLYQMEALRCDLIRQIKDSKDPKVEEHKLLFLYLFYRY